MTRLQLFVTVTVLFMSLYTALWLDLLPTPFIDASVKAQILPTIPFNLLVALGSYCLFELGWGILTFGDCQEAQRELMQEIQEAREELKKKGVSVD